MGSDEWADLDNHPSRFTIRPEFKELIEEAEVAKGYNDRERLRAIENELLDMRRTWIEEHLVKKEDPSD